MTWRTEALCRSWVCLLGLWLLDLDYSAFSAFYFYPINAAGFAHYHSSLSLILIFSEFICNFHVIYPGIRLLLDTAGCRGFFSPRQSLNKQVFKQVFPGSIVLSVKSIILNDDWRISNIPWSLKVWNYKCHQALSLW